MEVFIRCLRRKFRADLIGTVRGLGYRLTVPDDAGDEPGDEAGHDA